jgi:undecaprenyl-diphosphatase
MLEFLMELDTRLFLLLNGLHTHWLDPVMYYISYRFTWIPLYAVIAVLLGIRYKWKALLILLFIILLVTLSDQLSVLFKNYFERLRPCHEPDLQGMIHLVRGRCGGRFGFVSSHATNTFAFAIFIGMLFQDRFRMIYPVLLLWAFLNSYSRIYLGVHYPGDVISGALLGTAIAYFVNFLWNKTRIFLSRNKFSKAQVN